MSRKTEYIEFLAYVQDNFTEIMDDEFLCIDTEIPYSREEIVNQYLNL